ncbi:MAG: hypothetical protein Kow00122_06800 [Thermoleophilia bacterium]
MSKHALTHWLEIHKPRGGRRTQLLLAELMWTIVGGALLSVGLHWVTRRYGEPGLAYALPFLAVGLAKAFFVLDPVAGKTVRRIEVRGDSRCLGGFFSTRTWAVVAGMMLTGQVLRATPLPRADIGFLYAAVGSALLVSSRVLWRAWWGARISGAQSAR